MAQKNYDSFIGKNSTFDGNIASKGSIRVEGSVNGDIAVEGDVCIGPKANIIGNISASGIYIEGCIKGNICCSGLLKLFSSARLYGDIDVKAFVTDEGAIFEGKCSMNNSRDKKHTDKIKTSEKSKSH